MCLFLTRKKTPPVMQVKVVNMTTFKYNFCTRRYSLKRSFNKKITVINTNNK